MSKSRLEELQAKEAAALAAIATEGMENLKVQRMEAKVELYSNPDYVKALTMREAKKANIAKLSKMMDQINHISKDKIPGTNDDVQIKAFPVADARFGSEIGMILGLVTAANSAFTDSHKTQVNAIVKVDKVLLEEVAMAFGQTAYWSKKTFTVTDAIKGNVNKVIPLLEEVADIMGLYPIDTSKLNETSYNAYFAATTARAELKLAEFNKSKKFDEENSFKLPDAQ